MTIGGSVAPRGPGARPHVSGAAGDVVDSKYHYGMNHGRRGRFIIINNKIFMPHTQMNERKGTDRDASSLYTDFSQLGFDVTLFHNQTASQMLQLMTNGNV